jgi:DNA-binding NarL/FixJ family response regulator
MADCVRILIADDHPLMRAALRQAVSQCVPDLELAEAGTLDAALAAMRAAPPERPFDLVLLDLTMPGASGFAGLFLLRAEFPATAVVVVSASEDAATVRRSADYGAAGFIPKSALIDRITEAVRAVLEGGVWFPAPQEMLQSVAGSDDAAVAARLASLTPQQLRVLVMITDGMLNKQIAHELGVSEATVKAHVTVILRKLGVISRTQAVIAARALLSGTPYPSAG